MPDLLLEIGCEEIPAGALAAALPELERLVGEALGAAQLAPGRISTFGTPRRLALAVRGLPARQQDVNERIEGPPISAGEKAKAGFARKWSLEPAALAEEGGRFVARRQVAGKETRSLLPGLLAGLLPRLSWPKSMRWAHHSETFVRPVHWIVALYEDEVVP